VDLRNQAATAIPLTVQAMIDGEPDLKLTRAYMPDLMALVTVLGQVSGFYDADGHFARVAPVVNIFSYVAGNLVPNAPAPIGPRASYADLDFGIFRRCPGSASQVAADGSTPFLDAGGLDGSGVPGSDCTATAFPPGPPP
jgi:phospholipid/cholesterol/gamma-HCH transport system substrate-binding protein